VRASRGMLCCRRKLRGVSTKPRGPCVYGRRGFAASITEAAKLKIGANSSPSRVAPGPIPATLGIRALLAPNFRSRLTCSKRPISLQDLRLPFFLTEAAAPNLTTVFRITFIPHLLNCSALGPESLPTEDRLSVSGF
jgi:hypothetical protein